MIKIIQKDRTIKIVWKHDRLSNHNDIDGFTHCTLNLITPKGKIVATWEEKFMFLHFDNFNKDYGRKSSLKKVLSKIGYQTLSKEDKKEIWKQYFTMINKSYIFKKNNKN